MEPTKERIEVFYQPLGEILGVTWYHKYIVYTDSSGTQWIAQAGQNSGRGGDALSEAEKGAWTNEDSPYGEMVAGYGLLKDTDHYGSGDDPELIAEDDDLSAEWTAIKQAMVEIHNAGYQYRPYSQNSNSAVDEALRHSGLRLPEDDDFGEHWSPGSDVKLSYWDRLMDLIHKAATITTKIYYLRAEQTASPLVLDLDGDGIETVALGQGVYLDHDLNSFAEQSAWVGEDDGILFWDRNTDNWINDGGELFGNYTALSGEETAIHGFQALADLDTNDDGKIDSNDTNFNDLKILKGDGTAHTLSELGIQSLNLAYATSDYVDENGNLHAYVGSYTRTDSAVLEMTDVYFKVDTTKTISTEDVTVSEEVLSEIIALPFLPGSGTVDNLYQAMAKDATGLLQTLVKQFISEANVDNRWEILDNILYHWTGAQDINPTSRSLFTGPLYIDARQYHVLEQFIGRPYQNVFEGDLSEYSFAPNQGSILITAYNTLKESFYVQLLYQTHLSDLISEITVTYDQETDEHSLNLDAVSQTIETLNTTNPDAAKTLLGEFTRVIKGLNQVASSNYDEFYATFLALGEDYRWIMDTAGVSPVVTTGGDDNITVLQNVDNLMEGGLGNDFLDGGQGNDWVSGGSGNDTLRGSKGNDGLRGGEGNDNLHGGEGNDRLQGNEDDDLLNGGAGDDELLGGHGQDTLYGDFATSVAVTPVGNDTLDGGAGNDSLYGNAGDDILTGGSGNDKLYGGIGNDELSGGTGVDELRGEDGDDTYIFNLGDGQDLIIDSSGTDKLKFGAGITSEDLTFSVMRGTSDFSVANDLLITIDGTSDSIQIRGQLSSNTIETIEFNDQSTLSAAQILALLETTGTSGNDLMYGSDLTEQLNGGAGNDTIRANAGDDTLDGGDGNDSLRGEDGDDRLVGGAGSDSLDGGTGDDTYVFSGTWGADTISADASGIDTVDLSAVTANLTVNLVSGAGNEVSDGTNTVNWSSNLIENVIGGSGNDTLTGNTSANRLDGGAGNDTLSGSSGNDTYAFSDSWGADSISDSSGTADTIDFSGVTSNLTINLIASAGNEASDGTNTLNWSSNIIENAIGGSGNDTITGSSAINRLEGGAGDDSLDGGSGNDTYAFSNDWGVDTISADSAGTDTVDFVAVSSNLTINLAAGAGDEATDGINTVNWSSNIIEAAKGGSGDDSITGNSSDNTLVGNAGDDTLIGDAGNDSLDGGDGDDTYVFSGTWGADSITADSSGSDTIDLNAVTNNLTVDLTSSGGNEVSDGTSTVNWSNDLIENVIGGSGDDTITGNIAANRIEGGSGNDSLDGGAGDDTYIFSGTWGADTISADTSGADTVDLSAASSDLTINLASDVGDEVSDGTHTVNWADDIIENAIGGSGNDSITGTSGANVLVGNDGNDTLTGSGGDDSLDGGAGDDQYVFADSWGNDAITADDSGDDTVDLSAVTANLTVNLASGTGNEVTDGTNTIDWSNDVIENVLTGSGDDSITGNTANNSIDGGSGNDTYVVADDFGMDTIADASGTDMVDLSAVTTDLTVNLVSGGGDEVTDGTHTINWSSDAIENITSGSGNDSITGNSSANVLVGNAGDDTLTGAGGSDSLDGGSGDDTYAFADSWGTDTITGDASGTDTVNLSAATGNLTINLVSGGGDEVSDGTNTVNWSDNLIENAIGGSGSDTLIGNAEANRLDGGTGADSLDGGAGNDTYAFSDEWGADSITADSSGIDMVDFSSVSNALTINLESSGGHEASDGTHTVNWSSDIIENATGGSGNDTITGNDSTNLLMGSGGDDTLTGGDGKDTLDGGAGNDVYVYESGWGADSLTDSSGTDTIDLSAISDNLTVNLVSTSSNEVHYGINTVNFGDDVIENVTTGSGDDDVKGNESANTITTGSGNDTLVGRGGNDSLDGGAGNDIYQLTDDWGNDSITGDSSGTDEINLQGVFSDTTVNLNSGAGDEVTDGTNTVNWSGSIIENVTGGYGHDNITGNSDANVLTGEIGNDTLTGEGGNDSLDGGFGNDTYVFSGTWGADTVTGDESGSDTVDLSGATADLTINLVSSAGDEVTDGANTVNWSDDLIENAIGGSGNDTITGNDSNNRLDGSAGDDSLDGGAGDDTYVFSDNWGTDSITTDSSGTDTVDLTAVTSNLTINLTSSGGNEVSDGTNTVNWSSDVIENAFTGSGNDTITGNASANILDGGTGSDSLDGGAGDDTYRFTGAWGTDTISADSSGTDTVDLSASTSDLTVNLTSSGGNEVSDGTNTVNWSSDIIENAIGGSGNDTITGSTSANQLTGGAGNDSIDGGSGDDTYLFANNWGVDTLADSAGTDTVDLSTVTRDLTINLVSDLNEDEVTDGTNTINWASDVIENVKTGFGNDDITGNASNNTLEAGDGDDTYRFQAGWGADTIVDTDGTDTVDLSAISSNLTVNLTSSGSSEVTDSTNTINWADDAIDNIRTGSGNDSITGSAGDNIIEAGAGNDTIAGGDGNDTYVFSDGWGTDSISDLAGTDVLDLTNVTTSLTVDFANSTVTDGTNTVSWSGSTIEQVLLGSGSHSLSGGGSDDLIVGQALNDTISAGGGNDTITGGAGNDSLDGGTGDDMYLYANGWGDDTISDASGTDTVDLGSVTSHLTIDLVSSGGDEVSDGQNTMNWSSNAIENITAGYGNDSISGSSANNVLIGGFGNDTLAGKGGDDTLDGGTGDDVYVYENSWGHDSIIDDSGNDTLDLSAITGQLVVDLESSGGDEVAISGSNLQSINWEDSVIENVIGGSGSDSITGNAEDNILQGNDGSDTLDGQAGNDIYVYADDWGFDTILDSDGVDTVDLSATTADLGIDLDTAAGDEIAQSSTVSKVNWVGDIIENAIGGSGNDTISGHSGANSLYGNDGNDILNGAGGNDLLDGGNGNDTFQFSSSWGNDTIADDAGEDTLDLSSISADLTINMESDPDADEVTDGTNTVNWNEFSGIEKLVSGSGNDQIVGNTGNNTLDGGEGDDTLNGVEGDDTYVFTGDWGNDLINGDTQGQNTLDFSAISSNLTATLVQSGSDEVVLGANTLNLSDTTITTLRGGTGTNNLTGDDIDNALIGNGSTDTLTGGAGNDSLTGAAGNDQLDGGSGDDTYFYANDWNQDTITDASGIDTVDFSAVDKVLQINLESSGGHEAQIRFTTHRINWDNSIIENVISGTNSDSITGSTYDNYMEGNLGDDVYIFKNNWGQDTISDVGGSDTIDFSGVSNALTITLHSSNGADVSDGTNTLDIADGTIIEHVIGGSGADNIQGDDLENIIEGGSGSDLLDGGNGDDYYIFRTGFGHDTIADSSGSDTVDFSLISALNFATDLSTDTSMSVGTNSITFSLNSIENVIGTIQHDSITGNSLDNYLDGARGNDTLDGGAGNDTVDGNYGDDIINGGAGDDILGSAVSHTVDDDTYVFEGTWGNDTIVEGTPFGSEIDTVDLTAISNALTVDLTSSGSDEVSDGTNTINWDNNAINRLLAGSGDDSITGNSSNNDIEGQGGNDTISAGAGNDTISGGSGNDLITGGTGSDSLLGGSGNDTYNFAQGDGIDIIFDSGNSDTVVFDDSVAQSVVAVFKTAGGDLEIGYTDSAGDLITIDDFDTSGNEVEVFQLDNGNFMTDTDINQVIADMAAYASANSISFTSLDDVKNSQDLMNIVNAGWHS